MLVAAAGCSVALGSAVSATVEGAFFPLMDDTPGRRARVRISTAHLPLKVLAVRRTRHRFFQFQAMLFHLDRLEFPN